MEERLIAVGAGMKHNLFEPADVEHIGLKGTSQMVLGPDGNAYQLHIGTTFDESRKVDALLDASGELDTKEARRNYREQVENGPVGNFVKEALTSGTGLYDFRNGELVAPETLADELVIGAYVYPIPLDELYEAGSGHPANPADFAYDRMEDSPGFKQERGWIPAESGLRLVDADFTQSRFFRDVCAHIAESGGLDSWSVAEAGDIELAASFHLGRHDVSGQEVGIDDETTHETEQVEIYDSARFSDLDVWKERIVEEIGEGATHWVETYGMDAGVDDISDDDAAMLAELDQREDFEMFVSDLDKLADGHTLVALGQRGLWSGMQASGFLADDAQDLFEHAMQGGCDEFSVWDEDGELHISASHHDGSNSWQVRILDDSGEDLLGELEDGDEPDFMKLWENASKPEYAKTYYGIDNASHDDVIHDEHEQERHASNQPER